MRKGKVARAHDMGEYLGRVWLFNVTFAPHETVAVRHTYYVPGSYVVDGTQVVLYVTRTGALWAGPIGLARFHVQVPSDTTWFEGPKELPAPSIKTIQVEQTKYVDVTYEMPNWTPDGDLSFAYRAGTTAWEMSLESNEVAPDGPARSGMANTERCQSFAKVLSLGRDLAEPSAHRISPTEAEIEAALHEGINTRRICKNGVFALHGRRFQDDRLNRYFYGKNGFVPGSWPYDTMTPNPTFEQSQLTKGEWKAIELFERLPADNDQPARDGR